MKYYWLYLEPYSFIWRFKKNGLIYNTLTYESIEFKNIGIIKNIMDQIVDIKNMYCTKISEKELNNNLLRPFILKLKMKHSGGIIKCNSLYYKPVFLPPKLKFVPSIDNNNTEYRLSNNDNNKRYLKELNLYINGTCIHNCSGCQYNYKQTLFCTKSENKLSLEDIIRFTNQIDVYSLRRINIIGGNIFNYNISELYFTLNKFPSLKMYHINYRNANDGITFINEFLNDNNRLNIMITFPVEESIFDSFFKKISQSFINYLFMVASIEEFNVTLRLIDKYNIDKYEIKPIYTGSNISFFMKYVFMSKNDIINTKLSRQQIFQKEVINSFDFGKITIKSDSTVFANVNMPQLGTINTPLNELLFNEINKGYSWKRTRIKFEPCSTCVYQLLCPSPSNYEIILNKYNFCNIIN